MKYIALLTSIVFIHSYAMETTHNNQFKRGALIAIEGIDGSGKSTLAQHLYKALKQKYNSVILTKEPGDTEVGKEIREIVQQQTEPLNPKTEFLLFAADRAEHFSKVIIPALEKKSIIISDRLADSSMAYQGYGRDLNKNIIRQTNEWAMYGTQPNLTIFVKVPVKIALERIAKRNENRSAFEKKPLLKKVANGFEEIYKPYIKNTDFETIAKSFQKDLIKVNGNCVNLVIVDDVDFEEIHGNCIRLITVDGRESEEIVAQKTITAVERWIENHCK